MYKIGDVLYPTNASMKMGMSIIMDSEIRIKNKKDCNIFDEIAEEYVIYSVVTDFGNVVLLTKEELSNNFDILYHCEDPKERMMAQLRNLQNVLEKFYFGKEE